MRSIIMLFFTLPVLFFPAFTSATESTYAGNYSGTFSGGESGSWVLTISSTGAISGSGVNSRGLSGSMSGQSSADGSITMGIVSSGASFTGSINAATGAISGTWTDSSSGKSGTWSGTRVSAPTNSGGFTACSNEISCTEMNLSFTCPSSTSAVTSCPTSNLLGICTASADSSSYNWKVFAYLPSGMDSAQGSALADSWASSCSSEGNLWSAGNVTVDGSNPKVTQPSALIASGSFVEPNDTPAEATPMLVNDEPLYQFLSSVNDEDWFEVYAKAGQRYTASIPAASIGKMINPQLQLYDAAGNLIMSETGNATSGQDRQITWTATVTGLFRIRVSDQALPAKKSSAVELKGEAADYSYQIRVFLTDAPQQVLTKGRVLDNCGQGINEANVSARLGGVLADSTLTDKIGEFGLLLNPGTYDLKILATNFQEASQSVVVTQTATPLADIKLSPTITTGCVSNPATLAQQAPAVYEDQLGILIIKDILIGDKAYYVELKNIGNFRFQLAQFFSIPGIIHADPPEYVPSTLVAKLPKVFALNKTWKVQLRHNGSGILALESAESY
ncbi:carboxypeptidase regulatory-like domain-containing protein [Candidatus Methylobacter oryzae]|nr:carboxypeptidase regulatory-like domain-containing protein [Candidatus Methylobacter oryzae]